MSETVNVTINAEDLPELGTSEAALCSCVNLISRATGQPEKLLAYWLDLYYQIRKMQEQPRMEDHSVPPLSREQPEASRPPLTSEKASEIPGQFEPVAPKRSPQAEAAAFKRAVLARLERALAEGQTSARLVKIANGSITAEQILSIRERKAVPVAVYRVLDAVLDKYEDGRTDP